MTIGRRQFLLGGVSVVALAAALPAQASQMRLDTAPVSLPTVRVEFGESSVNTALWPPTKAQLLRSLYRDRHRGIAVYSPEIGQPLVDDGLAEWRETREIPNHFGMRLTVTGELLLTDKGLEAARMLAGETTMSRFRQPDWLLVELTR